MATNLAQAYVQIIPSAKGISGSIASAIGGEATSAGKSAGLNLVNSLKGVIAAAGIGAALKSALDAGGALQQSFGGLDTIYGDAAEAAKKYATEASKAGISMNTYSEQAVSFGASLKQAYGGDTVKAVEAANVAIMDMADNSAKMGTDINAVQNAYQGFAKQNYTMLDNLKLGYGGTKTEMERLLADAEKLSGVKYDISNLGDVYQAIHVIQEDLGLTGVAAAEAEGTFTGSMAAMKASAENLLANLALGNSIQADLESLGGNLQAFLFNNLLPMVENVLSSLPTLISGVSDLIIQTLNKISESAPEIAQQGVTIVTSLVEAIISALPYLIEAVVNLALALGQELLNMDWMQIGTDLINSLKSAVDIAATEIFGLDTTTVDSFLEGITNALPNVLDKGIEIITNLADGILKNIPAVITGAGELMTKLYGFLFENYPVILQKGFELIQNLASGIIKNLPAIATAIVQVIAKLLATVGQNLPKILQSGVEIIGKMVAGLIKAIPQVVAAIPQIVSAIINTFGNVDWGSIGINLINGIANGILNAAGSIIDAARSAAQSAFDAACDWLGIESPAKRGIYIGEMLDKGFALGVEDNMGIAEDAVEKLANSSIDELTVSGNATFGEIPTNSQAGSLVINMTINGTEGQDINALAELVQEKIASAVERRKLVYA